MAFKHGTMEEGGPTNVESGVQNNLGSIYRQQHIPTLQLPCALGIGPHRYIGTSRRCDLPTAYAFHYLSKRNQLKDYFIELGYFLSLQEIIIFIIKTPPKVISFVL